MEAPRRWPLFCRRVTNPDFKTITRNQIGELPGLSEVGELEEIRQVYVGEAKEQYNLRVWANIFALSWQTLINDDLDAMTRLPQQRGAAAGRKEDTLAFSILTANPVMADGHTLFSAAHRNLASVTGVPSVATLNAMSTAMGTHQGLTVDEEDPIYLDLEPKGLITPHALSGTARQLLRSTADPASNNSGVANIWDGELELVKSGRLDGDSTTAWYGYADPAMVDTIEVAFLQGMEQPDLAEQSGFRVLAREYRVVHVVEAHAVDYRGLYKNAG